MRGLRLCFASILPLFSGVGWAQPNTSQDWLTWGGDPGRTGWARAETTLSRDNVGGLELKWKTQLDNPSKVEVLTPLTAPLVAENVRTRQGKKTFVFVVGSEDIVYGLDADSGKVVWQRRFPNSNKPILPPTPNCPNTQFQTRRTQFEDVITIWLLSAPQDTKV